MPGAVSVDPDASTVQVACGQLAVNDATGATFGTDVWSGLSTTVHIVALPSRRRLPWQSVRVTRRLPLARSGRKQRK